MNQFNTAPAPTFTSDPPTKPHRRAPRRHHSLLKIGCLPLLALMLLCMLLYVIFPPKPVDILILGVDAQPNERYLTRTDTVMMLNVSPGNFGVALLSIPRDVFIYVPNYGEQRINVVNVLGEQEAEGYGPTLLKAGIQESFGVEVENYIRLDFQAFVALIDAVGGVDIDVPKLIIDYEYPTADNGTMTVQFDPGVEHMDGTRALQYARTRHQDDDYQRAGRQQQVVDALIKELANPLNIYKLPAVWRAIDEHTDTDMSAWDMLRTAPALFLGWPGKEQRVLQREDLISMSSGYWRPNYDIIMPWINEHFD